MRLLPALAFVVATFATTLAFAQKPAVTPEQRKELAAISQQVGDASKLLRKKQVDEAEKAIEDAETRLKALLDAGVPESERLVSIIQRNIALRHRAIALQRGEKPASLGVSFSEEIAPIINGSCVKCHGANDPKGGLRLDTFAGWEKGGASKQPLGAVLLPRLTTPNAQQRMPKGQEPLTQFQLQSIAKWIQEGAKFDGRGKDAPIGEKASEEEKEEKMPVIAKPTGGETVSFVNDVAPFMTNICGQCHMGNNIRGGFNITTFEGVMKGGESGQVIEPGDPDASRLWLMVSNKEQPRMPPGQLRITRENYDALTTWIKEGAKFDGDDPKKPLRDLVPTMGEMQAKELAKLSPDEFVAHRRTKSDAEWKKAFPKEPTAPIETEQFLVYGNVSADRAKQIAAWADEQAASLHTMFAAKEKPLWKGKLTIFVAKDRFGYEEFALAVNNREQVPTEVHGHAVVSPDFDDAYIVLEDRGDEPTAASPGMRASLANFLTQAFLLRGGTKLPDLVVQGTGLYVASKPNGAASKGTEPNPYFTSLRAGVEESLKSVTAPARIFADGTFPPGEAAAVGYALVDYLMTVGKPLKFSQFIKRLSETGDPAVAIEAVYQTTPGDLATLFAQSLSTRRK
jgi:mono/diheme cytochrome c family protein